jgi:hypothetical protein
MEQLIQVARVALGDLDQQEQQELPVDLVIQAQQELTELEQLREVLVQQELQEQVQLLVERDLLER